jgi:hypothetical protein
MTFLLDCSHYQGTINWTQVKTDGCVGAYIKVTDGATGVDAMWQTNHAGATSVGIPVGPYHFAEGGNVSAEAGHFASIWPAGWQLHPTLDYEISSANAGWLAAFRTDFRQDSGFGPFRLYSSVSLLNGPLKPSGWLDAQSSIWAAEYGAALAFNSVATVLWQNTSAATIPGILGNVDEDQFQNGWTPAVDLGATMDWTDSSGYTPPGATQPISYGQCLVFGVQAWLSGGTSLPGGEALANVLQDIKTGETTLASQITADQSALLAAVQGVQAGTVNVANLAQALVPILAPADAAAFQAALATALSK